MNIQHFKPVKSDFGILRGRDAIILGHILTNPISGKPLTIDDDFLQV